MRQRSVDDGGVVERVARWWNMLHGEVECGCESLVGECGKATDHGDVFHVHLCGEDAPDRRRSHGGVRVSEKMLEVHPGPRGRMLTKATPQKARKGQKGAGAESKLAVNAVRESGRNSCVDAGSVDGGAVQPPIPDAAGFG